MSEASPAPAPGPRRAELVNVIDARARKAEDALNVVLQRYLDRSRGVILARARGPKARKHTRWWTDLEAKVNPGQRGAGAGMSSTVAVEHKALDPDYVVPDKVTAELREEIEPVALRIATEAAAETADRLGAGELAMYDADEVAAAVEEAIGRLLGVADRHVREIRKAVLAADTDAGDLDEVLDRVEAAHRKGGNWVLMSGRTLANALANDAALRTAKKLGVTHTQWISKRDDRVRITHVVADGQVRPIGERFKVGRFHLHHPGDPSDLPDSWGEIAGCRCGLLFRKPSDAAKRMREMADAARADAGHPQDTASTLRRAMVAAAATPDGETLVPTPEGYDLPPVASLVTLAQPIVAYRALSAALAATPGQRIKLPGTPVLALAPPAEAAVTLVVMIPAGTQIGVAGGAITLPEGAALELLGMSADEIQAHVIG